MASSYKVIDALLKVALLPSHIEFPIDAVKEQLNDMLFKYNDEIAGVPIVYYDIDFPPNKQAGRILNELPWIHVDILAKILVFQPSTGTRMVGQISKVSENHMSLLVCGMFNASILEPELLAKYSYNEAANSWESDTEMLSESDYLEFQVQVCHNSHGVFYIEGTPIAKCMSD